MADELKTAGVIGLVGAAAGAGPALEVGLRLFSALAMVGPNATMEGKQKGVASGRAIRASQEAAARVSCCRLCRLCLFLLVGF